MSDSTRRISALSSTIRTLGRASDADDIDSPRSRTSTRPSATKNRTERPASPPPLPPASGIAGRAQRVAGRDRIALPICTDPGVMSWREHARAAGELSARCDADQRPAPPSCSTRNGTAVSGNFAGLDGVPGESCGTAAGCAPSRPPPAWGSCSMMATHEPRPRVTIASSPRLAAQSATRTMVSLAAGGSCGPAVDPLARIFQLEALARGPDQGLRPCRAAGSPGTRRVGERLEQTLLHRPVEVDDHVAAHDQIVGRIGGGSRVRSWRRTCTICSRAGSGRRVAPAVK